jgi:hypothetical protein
MLEFLKTLFLGYEPKLAELPPQREAFYPVFGAEGRSMGEELMRRGWQPHEFGRTKVAVCLPPQLRVRFSAEGILQAAIDTPHPVVSATLHGGFEENPALAGQFVLQLSQQKRLMLHHVGTHSCFYDPSLADPNVIAERHFVIAMPGAVVSLSIHGTREFAATPLLQEVRNAVPYLVGRVG